MAIIVQKYGGTSVGSVERIYNVARRVAAAVDAGHSVAVVVSAMGDTTDELVALARSVTACPSEREMAVLLSTGEQVTVALLAMALENLGCGAVSFTGPQAGVVTDGSKLNSRITAFTAVRVKQAMAQGKVAVVAGLDRKSVV